MTTESRSLEKEIFNNFFLPGPGSKIPCKTMAKTRPIFLLTCLLGHSEKTRNFFFIDHSLYCLLYPQTPVWKTRVPRKRSRSSRSLRRRRWRLRCRQSTSPPPPQSSNTNTRMVSLIFLFHLFIQPSHDVLYS